MITGEQGLFAQTNHAANTYKAAQENEAIHLDALMNSEYLTGLVGVNLSLSTPSTTGTIYGIYDMAGGAGEYVMKLMAPNVVKIDSSTEGMVGISETSNSGFFDSTGIFCISNNSGQGSDVLSFRPV